MVAAHPIWPTLRRLLAGGEANAASGDSPCRRFSTHQRPGGGCCWR
jgi:hypothetical protein